jgi:hypothetical protein
MRDVVAGVLAVVLLLTALSLGSGLHAYRRRRRRNRDAQAALGRSVIAEIPADDDLALFSDDGARFYYRDRSVEQDQIVAVRVLINGTPIASYTSQHLMGGARREATSFEDRPEGIARDRWDVAIETTGGTTLVECGAIRERVSQELARAVFDAVKADMERRDRAPRPTASP